MSEETVASAFEAVRSGDLDGLRRVVRSDRSVASSRGKDGLSLILQAAYRDRTDMVDLLLEAGADLSAVAAGRRSVAEALLSSGAPVDARSHGGFTPLLEAAENGDRALVELLLRAGADPSIARDDGKRPIDVALAKGHDEVAELLEDRG